MQEQIDWQHMRAVREKLTPEEVNGLRDNKIIVRRAVQIFHEGKEIAVIQVCDKKAYTTLRDFKVEV